MLDDRSYMRENPHRSVWPAHVILMVVIGVCFTAQAIASHYFDKFYWIYQYLALSPDGLKRGFVWQLLTFQFLHDIRGPLHILGNVVLIWFFGRPLEERYGASGFLKLYFLCGTIGGVLQAGLGFVFPTVFGHPTVGASAGALGLLAGFALMEPYAEICFMFFLRMRAKYLLWIELGISTFFTVIPTDLGIAHAAHLGGILAAIAYMRWDIPKPNLNWNLWQGRRRKRQLVQAAAQVARARGKKREQSPTELPPEEFISKEVDPILDKISAHGIHSLTPRERQILEAARSKIVKR
jgi:membrane associated rhomboid family serine protease